MTSPSTGNEFTNVYEREAVALQQNIDALSATIGECHRICDLAGIKRWHDDDRAGTMSLPIVDRVRIMASLLDEYRQGREVKHAQ